jgi:SAM-dependent methyltransferase
VSLRRTNEPSNRTTFDTVAATYGDARPPLPDGLIDELVALTRLPPGGRVLEVGPGPGNVTSEFAARGYEIVGVELGTELAATARRNLAAFPKVTIEHSAFETWPLPASRFDVVTAFHAWHWLDPAVGLAKAAGALGPGGAIAIVGADHVAGGDTEFFADVQDCYERHMPGTPPGLRLRDANDIPSNDWGIAASDAFDEPHFRRWLALTEYTTETYLQLLGSFSNHIALADDARDALFGCVAALLDRRYGGRINKAMVYELCVARRRGASVAYG